MSDSFAAPKTVACQASLPVEFYRQEYWSGLPFHFSGYLPDPGIELKFPSLAGGFFTTEPTGKSPVREYHLAKQIFGVIDIKEQYMFTWLEKNTLYWKTPRHFWLVHRFNNTMCNNLKVCNRALFPFIAVFFLVVHFGWMWYSFWASMDFTYMC